MAQMRAGFKQQLLQVAKTTARPPLLDCIDQLNPDTWAQVLLPKLTAQGSASSVALTCSTLRDLCNSNVQELKLKAVPGAVLPITVATVQSWANSLAAHFPSCRTISVGVGCAEDCELTGHMMPALARLPKLDSISLTIDPATPRQPQRNKPGVVSLLRAMRKHLSGMHNLSLTSKQNWQGAGKVWSELAQATQLTSLTLVFTDEASNACTGAELGALGKLQQLRALDIAVKQPPKNSPYQLHPHHLLSKLTSLTALQFEPCTPHALGCFSSCTSLQSLSCSCGDGDETVVAPADWNAVGQLTGLTRLQLLSGLATTASKECILAFGQLRHLVSFAAGELSLDIFTALSACTKLMEIQGGWCSGVEGEGEERASITMPSVLALTSTGGPVPFAAFPNLQKVRQADAICSTALSSLSMHCKDLQELKFAPATKATDVSELVPFFSVSTDEQGDSLVAAWRDLGDLQGLSKLSASVQDDMELISLVSAANSLVRKSLTRLSLYLGDLSYVSVSGLLQLARLSGLRELQVTVVCWPMDDAEDAFSILCALWGIDEVIIITATHAELLVVEQAASDLYKSGLPAPKRIAIAAC